MGGWIIAWSATFAEALSGTMVMPLIVMAVSRLPGIDEGLATAIVLAAACAAQIFKKQEAS